MSGISSRSALRARGGRAWEALFKKAPVQTRCLHLTPSRQVEIPSFDTTRAPPELKEALNTLRSKIILPSYLSPETQKMLFRPKHKKRIEADPPTIEINDEVIQFAPMNRLKDLPAMKPMVNAAINNMKSASDFQNLRPLLDGLRHAHRTLPEYMWTRMTRKAALANALPSIMTCVQHVDKTHFKLNQSVTVNELLGYIQQKAVDKWEFADLKRALGRTRMILEVLETEPLHKRSPDEPGAAKYPSLHQDPQIQAARLHMAAAMAVRHYKGKDKGGLVEKYARELLTLWPRNKGLLTLYPKEAYENKMSMHYLTVPGNFTWYAAPMAHGLKLAAQIVPELAPQLLSRAKTVECEIKDEMRKHPLKARSQAMYDALFNPEKPLGAPKAPKPAEESAEGPAEEPVKEPIA
ncbi:hypothetical protein B0T26DRAFT_874238 [Lasiosphaeria miniovina]|uniref:Uncharacterized protein n=1 Tax=Lasiosphaeria miniovina TaxID=1954250 RepID=A0AA40A4F0_9PEZI|nr:uncharacterized protein B0T26DRAFT_874238 [Lasiosphaeria miniovina]KAK0709079.1 hypothetical protein B0T26DRAFT_874238 [Lasiosphaeria miniovina]